MTPLVECKYCQHWLRCPWTVAVMVLRWQLTAEVVSTGHPQKYPEQMAVIHLVFCG